MLSALLARHTRRRASHFVCVVALLATARIATAQTCSPATSSNEAKLFGVRSLTLVMSPGAVSPDAAGTIRGGVEIAYLPWIRSETARPTTCRPGKEGENVNALPAVARARVSVVLGKGFGLEASWLPPVRIAGIRSNLLGLAARHTKALAPQVVLTSRVHATVGHVTGPFTCSEEAVTEPSSECHLGTVSSDRLEPNIYGADMGLGWTPSSGRIQLHGGGGVSRLMPRFQVHFRDAAGVLDTTRVEVDLTRIALFAGVTTAIGARLRASAEVYATTRDGATARVLFDALLRGGK
jgi:hypothetical protein